MNHNYDLFIKYLDEKEPISYEDLITKNGLISKVKKKKVLLPGKNK